MEKEINDAFVNVIKSIKDLEKRFEEHEERIKRLEILNPRRTIYKLKQKDNRDRK